MGCDPIGGGERLALRIEEDDVGTCRSGELLLLALDRGNFLVDAGERQGEDRLAALQPLGVEVVRVLGCDALECFPGMAEQGKPLVGVAFQPRRLVECTRLDGERVGVRQIAALPAIVASTNATMARVDRISDCSFRFRSAHGNVFLQDQPSARDVYSSWAAPVSR